MVIKNTSLFSFKKLFLVFILLILISVFSSAVLSEDVDWVQSYSSSLYSSMVGSDDFYGSDAVVSDNLYFDVNASNYYILWDQQASLSLPLISLAKKTNSGVFIVSKDNVADLVDYLDEKNLLRKEHGLEKITYIQVGDFPSSINEELSSYISDEINEESIQKTAEKIFSMVLDYESTDSVLLVSGRVLEEDLFLTEQPILLISDSIISSSFIDLVKKYSLKSFSSVEENLIPFAEELKKELSEEGIDDVFFFLKIGQSSSDAEGEIVPLDVIELPEADIDLSISSVEYNSLEDELVLHLTNNGESKAYVFASVDLIDLIAGSVDDIDFGNYSYLVSVGSTEAEMLGPEEDLVLKFNLSLDVNSITDLYSKIFLAYGESKKQLDKHLVSKETGLSPVYYPVEISSYERETIDLDVSELLYRSDKDAFEIIIKNPEEVELDAVLRVQNILVDGIERDFSSVVKIPSERSVHYVYADLSSKDQDVNKNISLEVQYKKQGENYVAFLHVVDEFSVFTVLPLVLSALFVFLLITFFELNRWNYRKKEKKTGIRWVKK